MQFSKGGKKSILYALKVAKTLHFLNRKNCTHVIRIHKMQFREKRSGLSVQAPEPQERVLGKHLIHCLVGSDLIFAQFLKIVVVSSGSPWT